MRLIGVLGGMSWESTKAYYELMNEETARRVGGLASARILLSSVDFSRYAAFMAAGDWDRIREALLDEACRLKRGGAEALVVATNTMHLFAAEMEAAAGVPLIHIADAAATAIARTGAAKVGLLGTRFTMEKDFYRKRLSEVHGIEAIVPEAEVRAEVDRIIFEELCRGRFLPESRERLRAAARGLAERGASGIVLGCTELPLVMKDGDLDVPYWDTTGLHASAAVDFMLGDAAAGPAPGPAPAVGARAHPSVAAMMEAYLASLPAAEAERARARGYASWHFCSDQAGADGLGRLAARGVKRATASSLRACERDGTPVPVPGDLSVITDWSGRALAVIETSAVAIAPFDRVDAAFAAREGEGDGSLAYWRDAHRGFFGSEHATLGLPFDEGIPVICEDFRLVWPRPAGNGAA